MKFWLLHSLAVSTRPVLGVSSIDNEIFVLYWSASYTCLNYYDHDVQSSLLKIGVYSASTFESERHAEIPVKMRGSVRRTHQSQNKHTLTACSHNKCLFVSDKNNCIVHNVSARMKKTPISQWSTESPPSGLSMNSAHNVLVACGDDHMFLEYTSNGSLVQKINLRSDIENPVQVVQLCSGRYGIIHQGSTPGYSVIDHNGKVINRYTRPERKFLFDRVFSERDTDVLRAPCALAVLRPRKVLIVDQKNNRILALTETENSFTAKRLPESVCDELNQPSCMHYDASRRRLYIGEYDSGENDGCRVLCYKI